MRRGTLPDAERLGKFGLELHPAKTRWIEFGRWAIVDRRQRGEGKPEPFDFLGFTHICKINPKSGYFVVKRKTVRKRKRAKLADIKKQLRQRMHAPLGETGEWLRSVVLGYFRYHAVPGNLRTLAALLQAGESLFATASYLSSVSERAVCGHASKVRAV